MSDPLDEFSPPARWNDFFGDAAKTAAFRAAWSAELLRMTRAWANPRYYDPTTTVIGDAQPQRVAWTAFPKREAGDFAAAETRTGQKEYCEWCVAKNAAGKVTRVAFTTETPEYWQALWDFDRDRVLALYRQLVGPAVQLADLRDGAGNYRPANIWNSGHEYAADGGGLVHYIVDINTLDAAIGVVARAAASTDDDVAGGESFHADPLIRHTVERVVHRLRMRVSFSDPVGIYLQEPEFHRFELPAAAPVDMDPQDLYRVVRGDRRNGRALHAVWKVPDGHGFVLGDVKVDGQPIRFGSQIARAVKSGSFVTPIPQP